MNDQPDNGRLLPSWRDGETRNSIIEFLGLVEEIPPVERVAVFDNDGTMWAEKPNYTQLEFFLQEMRAAVTANPALADRTAFRAILEGDIAALKELGVEGLGNALLDLFAGLTPEEFTAKVMTFFTEARHPETGMPYRQRRYQPMVELIDELRARGFDFYIVSAGGTDFVRAISMDFYGVSPEGIVGSQIDYELSRDNAGRPRLRRTSHLVHGGLNEGVAKVSNIFRVLGRRPVVAAGNSAGDTDMLEYTAAYDGPSLAMLVKHDDDVREYSYAGKAETFNTDESILTTADRLGWAVISMRDDWSTIFTTS